MILEIRNRQLEAAVNDEDGSWAFIRSVGSNNESLLRKNAPLFDLVIDGKPFFGKRIRKPVSTRVFDSDQKVELVYECEGIRLIHCITLDSEKPLLTQQLKLDIVDGTLRKLTAVNYFFPCFVVGNPADCLFRTFDQHLPPEVAYATIAAQKLDSSVDEPLPGFPTGWFTPSPDQGSGLIAVENRSDHRIASIWHQSTITTSFTTVNGDGEYISIGCSQMLGCWLKKGVSVVSKGPCLLLTNGSVADHTKSYRSIALPREWECPADSPAWMHTMRLLQIDPYPITKWTSRLQQIRDMNFNTIYCMPVVDAGYNINDHYAIFPRVGTQEELRTFVNEAHKLDIKVLFDFIPQGISIHSPFIQKHPNWVVHDELERPIASHGWGPRPGAPLITGTFSLDWAIPEYQDFVVEWALWYLKTFDIDGFRTDALHWKEPNFSLDNPRPAYKTVYGGVSIADKLLPAMRAVKKEAILLAEVGGPIFMHNHDCSYQNGWITESVFNGWLRGKPVMTGSQYTSHLAQFGEVYPTGALWANFSSNHDLPHLAQGINSSPLGEAIDVVAVFSDGIPFVCWLEFNGREEFFGQLMAVRKSMEGYQCRHGACSAMHEALFTSLWVKSDGKAVLAVANVTTNLVKSVINLSDTIKNFTLLMGSKDVKVAINRDGVSVELGAGGYVVIST